MTVSVFFPKALSAGTSAAIGRRTRHSSPAAIPSCSARAALRNASPGAGRGEIGRVLRSQLLKAVANSQDVDVCAAAMRTRVFDGSFQEDRRHGEEPARVLLWRNVCGQFRAKEARHNQHFVNSLQAIERQPTQAPTHRIADDQRPA